MTKETEKNYTEAQEARIQAVADENGFVDNALAEMLAIEFGKDVRSVRAKAVRMNVYKAKPKVSKSGGKVESKADIVNEISKLIGANMEGLESAPKLALQRIRDRLSA